MTATDLQELPGIGPRLAADLRAVGIADAESLRLTGVAESARRLADAGLRDGTHAARALGGALQGVRWSTREPV